MGEILLFEPRRFGRRHTASQDRVRPSSATIVIFPGVRYERRDEAALRPRAKAEARISGKPKPRPSHR
jgi:hypothetical protein